MNTINLVYDIRGGLLAALSSDEAANRFLALNQEAHTIHSIDLDEELPALHMDTSRYDVTILADGQLQSVEEDLYSYEDLTNPPLVICGWQRDPVLKWNGGRVRYWKVELCATSDADATCQARAIIANLTWQEGAVYRPGPNNLPGTCNALACDHLERCVAWSAEAGRCLICTNEQSRQAALTRFAIIRSVAPDPVRDAVVAW